MIPLPVEQRRDAEDAAEWLARARRGDFETAWRISDRIRSRLTAEQYQAGPRHVQLVWDGSPLHDRRVLIRCYHGLGDTIQFIRYAPAVRVVASSVTVWAQPALLPLLGTVGGIDRLLPLHDGSPGIEYDVDIEVMELPYAFRTTLATIPASVPYLRATPASCSGSGCRIAIAWRAGDWDHRRSIPFELISELFERPGISWFSLQLDRRVHEAHPRLACPDVIGVSATASVMLGMDLVISIDSMSAHLAGALGIAVWTLLPFDADWRWMEGRSDSPWYPTMRLFRQARPGDWGPVIEDVSAGLREQLD
jgi:hypothetical protein